MARSFRSRRYRPRLRRRYRIKKSSLSKIKKDILKCNFPTKVKFMGLTERKVMFLTYQKSIEFSSTNKDRALYLIPSVASNWKSIVTDYAATIPKDPVTGATTKDARLPNWDKICILGIYIKVQPNFNMFQGGAGKTIRPVKCFYAMDSCPSDRMIEFDKQLLPYKQVFTFNSNEAFTIYLPAPTTMDFNTSVVHRSKTWWSLAGIKTPKEEDVVKGEMSEDGEDGEDDQESDVEEGEFSAIFKDEGDVFHCGRLAFQCEGDAEFNVTINYKVALKG